MGPIMLLLVTLVLLLLVSEQYGNAVELLRPIQAALHLATWDLLHLSVLNGRH